MDRQSNVVSFHAGIWLECRFDGSNSTHKSSITCHVIHIDVRTFCYISPANMFTFGELIQTKIKVAMEIQGFIVSTIDLFLTISCQFCTSGFVVKAFVFHTNVSFGVYSRHIVVYFFSASLWYHRCLFGCSSHLSIPFQFSHRYFVHSFTLQ